MSNREKKKAIAAGVSKLRNKPGWDPAALQKQSPEETLRDLGQSERTEQAYSEENACEACVAARQKSSDDTALCEDHFAKLMGF